MLLLIFGIGKFYEEKKEELYRYMGKDKIVAFVDNCAKNICSWDTRKVFLPNDIITMEFDAVVIMSIYSREIISQLRELGVKKKIYLYDEYISEKMHGQLCAYITTRFKNEKRALLLTPHLGYHGAAVALIYAAKALHSQKYDVMIITPKGEQNFIDEVISEGINVTICRSLPYISETELFWIERYDVIIANTLFMLPAICEIAKEREVLCWIHENDYLYEDVLFAYHDYIEMINLKSIYFYAVSKKAQENFKRHLGFYTNGILPYGLSDDFGMQVKTSTAKRTDDIVTFACIGTFIVNALKKPT